MGVPTLNSPAEIVQALLVLLNLATLPPRNSLASNRDWPVFATVEPNEPDNCLTVYDTSNQYDGRSMKTGENWVHYGVQVRVRGVDHPTAYQKAYTIYQALLQNVGGQNGPSAVAISSNPSVNSNNYLIGSLVKVRGPYSLGQDTPKSKRRLFTINALLVL